jgi:copper resistance protein D
MLSTLVICRWVHYTAAMLLFGASTFVWLLAPPRLAATLNKSAGWLAIASGLLLTATAVFWLPLEAGLMGEGWQDAFSPDTIGAVLFGTEFGQAWQVHGLLVLGLLAGIATRRSSIISPTSALALASLGLIGHAAMQSGPIGWLHRTNLALHLLGGGFWLGGLVPLIATLRLMGEIPLRDDAIVALRRFSTLGHGAVALVVLTGIGNTVLILGASPLEPLSLYEELLVTKIALVGLMIGLALINRYRLAPRLRDRPSAPQALIRNSVGELVLGAMVIALVSLFGLLEPSAGA